jgi:DNA-binding NtrC family response regulator
VAPVRWSANGQFGVEFITLTPGDSARRRDLLAIMLDLKMPEMDGLMVLKEIRRIDEKLPVIVLTGAGTPETEQQAQALGVTEFVEKEFSLHRLGDSLKRHLNTPAARLLITDRP